MFIGSRVVFLCIVFALCIGNLLGYALIRPVRVPNLRRIPIRPLDPSTIRRLSRVPNEINPDAESIFIPMPNAKQRPMQVMERISAPIDNKNSNWNHKRNDQFNVLNFEAYVMKPTNPTIKPVTERVLRLITPTEDYRDDTKTSPSSQHKYRIKNAKKPKKNPHILHMKEHDDLEFYRAFLEHQKQAAMIKRLKPKPEQSSRLPIGMDFFEQKKRNKAPAFPPITYSPMYMNHMHRAQPEAEASNLHHVKLRLPEVKQPVTQKLIESTTPIQFTTMATPPSFTTVLPMDIERQTETVPPPDDRLDDSDAYHVLASAPEMFKFTIEDVIVKPRAPVGVKHPYTGPVTFPPPSLTYYGAPNLHYMRSERISPPISNSINDNRYDSHFQTQLHYPPQIYSAHRRFEKMPFRTIPVEEPELSQNQLQAISVEPITATTEMITTDTETDSVKTTVEAKQPDRRNKKRRLNPERYKMDTKHDTPANHRADSSNNLEVSSSYSKRRTQGYSSVEDIATTPIPSTKSKSNDFEDEHETKPPKNSNNENVKYFQ